MLEYFYHGRKAFPTRFSEYHIFKYYFILFTDLDISTALRSCRFIVYKVHATILWNFSLDNLCNCICKHVCYSACSGTRMQFTQKNRRKYLQLHDLVSLTYDLAFFGYKPYKKLMNTLYLSDTRRHNNKMFFIGR